MQLTSAQKTTLKTHMQANTNTVTTVGGQTAAINTLLGNSANLQPIADWYNGTALAGDNQPFSNRALWNPNVTVKQLNSAIKWQTPVTGTTSSDRAEQWLIYQSMIWNMSIDMSDSSVRKGIQQVFGNVTPGSAANIGAIGCGQLNGRRIELVFNSTAVGADTSWTGAAVCPVGLNGSAILGQLIQEPDLEDVLANG